MEDNTYIAQQIADIYERLAQNKEATNVALDRTEDLGRRIIKLKKKNNSLTWNMIALTVSCGFGYYILQSAVDNLSKKVDKVIKEA